jgi:hypothetical protein
VPSSARRDLFEESERLLRLYGDAHAIDEERLFGRHQITEPHRDIPSVFDVHTVRRFRPFAAPAGRSQQPPGRMHLCPYIVPARRTGRMLDAAAHNDDSPVVEQAPVHQQSEIAQIRLTESPRAESHMQNASLCIHCVHILSAFIQIVHRLTRLQVDQQTAHSNRTERERERERGQQYES